MRSPCPERQRRVAAECFPTKGHCIISPYFIPSQCLFFHHSFFHWPCEEIFVLTPQVCFAFKMPLLFECRLIIVFAERIIILQLSWSLHFSGWPGKVLLLDNFSFFWRERAVICSSVQISKEGEKYYTFSGGFCVWTPRTVEEEAVVAQEVRCIHRGGLSWHSSAAAAPHGSSARIHCGFSQMAPGTVTGTLAGKNLHILYMRLLSSASAMCLFFSLVTISCTWAVHCF